MKYVCPNCGYVVVDDRTEPQRELDFWLNDERDNEVLCPKCYFYMQSEDES